ncbi:MAG: hypothetical protein IT356_07495 [Gemmatimonadaceae bacterium]|nr:hypothetical protein [Gemmatimonadaceae bacterium]
MNAARAGLALACVVALPASGGAQESLLPSTGWGAAAGLGAWHFSTPIPQAAGSVADVAELAVPFRVRTLLGRWTFDLSGAGAVGAAHLSTGQGGTGAGEDRVIRIAGVTDMKLRLTGPLGLAGYTITGGVNIPTGKTGLDADEAGALQVVGAPALRMPVGAFGMGSGATLGLLRAFEGDDWALALGGSFEQRTEYSPIALALAAGKAETRVAPGAAVHVTAGFDRALGEGRWSLLAVGDFFAKDHVRFTGGAGSGTDYTLGPQLTLTSQIALAAAGWREASFDAGVRVRSEFADETGAKVSGSSGTYLEASLGGVRGGALGSGLVVGLDGRWHSGLRFTDALVGAAVTAGGLTLGYERAGDAMLSRFTVRGQYGTFDTGAARATGFGVTVGLSVAARRDAR